MVILNISGNRLGGLLLLILIVAHTADGAMPDATLRFTGTAVDADAHVLAGAMVEVYQNLYPKELYSPPSLLTNLTASSDGTFEFAFSGDTECVVRKPGLAPGWLMVGGVSWKIVLAPPTTLMGVVVDETGKPVRDAEVYVSVAHSGAPNEWRTYLHGNLARKLYSTRTDENGRFTLENFPANSRAELGVSAPGKVLPPRRVQYSTENLLCGSGQSDIRLVLESPVRIEGRVVTETDQPVADSEVELRADTTSFGVPWQSVVPVTNGTFCFTGISSGAYRIFGKFGTSALPDWVSEPVPVEVRAGQDSGGVEIKAIKGGVLEVKCVDKRTGGPVDEIFLTIYTGSDFVHGSSDTNGLYSFRVLPGSHRVVGTKGELRAQFAETKLESGQTNQVTLQFSSPPIVSGIVRDPDGKPCPGLQVWMPDGFSRGDLKTDANGRYQLVQRDNTHLVFVADQSRNLSVCRDIEEGVTNLDLTLAPSFTVTGRVQEAQSNPVANPKLHPYMNVGNMGYPLFWLPVVTNTEGHYKLTCLPTNWTYYILFGATGYGTAEKKIPTEDGFDIELSPVTLKRADLKLMGQVVDASGAALEKASLNVSGFGQPSIDVRTDTNGRFAFDVCEGRVHFSVWFHEMQTSVEAQAGDTNLVVVLKPRNGNSEDRPEPPKPKRASLVGKQLPALETVNLPADAAVRGKQVLICIFDPEQRPSRRLLRLLSEQNETLVQKGVTILAVSAAVMTGEGFEHWKQENPSPFKIGRVGEKTDRTRWAAETDMLPWLILADEQGKVTAEGFPWEDLPGKLGKK